MTPRRPLALVLVAILSLAACQDDGDGASTSTTDAPSTTEAPAGSSTTAGEPTTTVAPEEETALALRGDGVGVAAFGERPDTVLPAVSAVLGEPTEDSGWENGMTGSFGSCPADRIRGVSWDGLTLLFVDGDSGPNLAGWYLTGAPPAVATAAGFGFGASADDAHDAYGQSVELVPAEDPYPAHLLIDADGGTITAYLDEGERVTNLLAGLTCGE